MDQPTHPMQEAATLRLLAAALELQHLTGLAANMVPIPGGRRVIAIGEPAQAMDVLAAQLKPAVPTTLHEDVAALFGACGFEIRSTDPAEDHPFAVCGTLDAAGLVVEKLLADQSDPEAVPAEFLALLPGVTYMDPPDGGDVSVLEQFRRMAKDAARYRWLRDQARDAVDVAPIVVMMDWRGVPVADEVEPSGIRSDAELDRAVDVARGAWQPDDVDHDHSEGSHHG